MASNVEAEREQHATYLTLSSLFLSIFSAFAMRERKRRSQLNLQPFDLMLLGLATARLGRLAAYDKVASTLRLPFTETTTDSSGAGQTVVPKGMGARRALGELLACPICLGTWIAAALVYGLEIAPRPTRAFLAIMSSIGLAEVINAGIEALSWSGRLARTESGELFQRRM
jgi:hypothetical protein